MLKNAITENIMTGLAGVVDDVEQFLNWVYDISGRILENMTAAEIADAVCDYEDRSDPDATTEPENWGN